MDNGMLNLLERIDLEDVHAGTVAEEERDDRLDDHADGQHGVVHALGADRVATGLADDQVGALADDDATEVGRLAHCLQVLASVKILV